jgi:hypothetical protein
MFVPVSVEVLEAIIVNQASLSQCEQSRAYRYWRPNEFSPHAWQVPQDGFMFRTSLILCLCPVISRHKTASSSHVISWDNQCCFRSASISGNQALCTSPDAIYVRPRSSSHAAQGWRGTSHPSQQPVRAKILSQGLIILTERHIRHTYSVFVGH